jgi:outer membrane lipopolysaccharide assembly protein LptE/RlpB
VRKLLPPAAALFVLLTGCGYHVAGHSNVVPKTVKSIAIPAFGNNTQRYKLGDQLHRAVTREFIERTRYRIVAEPNGADAVLEGSLLNYSAYPTVFDQATSRASGVQTVVTVSITLRERATGNVIYQRQSWEIRERYEIATDPRAYLDESETAVERVSRDVARAVVSGVLSSF